MHIYGISYEELTEARRFIIKDIESNYEIKNPIQNMTLNIYFDLIKECILSVINEQGLVLSPYDDLLWSTFKTKDVRLQSSLEVAKDWMDGRGLFTEHFNGNLLKNEQHFGTWDNIDRNNQNQWYHEDRLDDIEWFKECALRHIGAAGHPTEMLTCGNFNPYMYEDNKWYLMFGSFSRNNFYMIKAYLYLKKKDIPIFIYKGEQYLTKTQLNKLLCKKIIL